MSRDLDELAAIVVEHMQRPSAPTTDDLAQLWARLVNARMRIDHAQGILCQSSGVKALPEGPPIELQPTAAWLAYHVGQSEHQANVAEALAGLLIACNYDETMALSVFTRAAELRAEQRKASDQ